MPLVALAGLATIGAIPLLTSTGLEAAAPHRYAVVRVRAGDTLWSIAQAHASAETDMHDLVDRIAAANGLRDVALVPGRRLRVPAP